MEAKDKVGYIFLCSDATEEECLERKLLGGKEPYLRYVKEIKRGNFVYCYNFNSKRLHGPFLATTGVEKNFVPSAWFGEYPYQVKYKKLGNYLPIHRDNLASILKFNNKGFPKVRLLPEQIDQLEILFRSEKRHTNYDDSAALIALDGHKVRSDAERKIDNWLYEQGIVHAYEYAIPDAKRCDFYLPLLGDTGVYIEYWGLNDKKYEANRKIKLEIYKKHNLNLIELTPKELKVLDDYLRRKLNL